MTKSELIEKLATAVGLKKKEAALALETFMETVKSTLKKGDQIALSGFGTFKIRHSKARMGRNPKTGEAIQIPERKKVVFRPSKELKDIVK